MKEKTLTQKVKLEDKCSASYDDYLLKIKGPKGEVKRRIMHTKINVEINNSEIVLTFNNATKREKTAINSYVAHINNMIKGVLHGYSYKLKICSGHFPMTVTFKNGIFEIKNFFGETTPRRVHIPGEIKITINGNDIVIDGIDKETTSQAAATIEQLTRRVGFDRRVFQDGIYIVEKDGKKIE